jgi:hypothetical protein
MNNDSSWFQWFGLALMRLRHRTIIKTDWQRQSFIHDRLLFAPGLHSRLACIRAWPAFAIGQRLWFGLVCNIAKTADCGKKQSLESPCLSAYI